LGGYKIINYPRAHLLPEESFYQNCHEKEGIIRTNLRQTDEKTMWNIYHTIREIEAVLRVLKSGLSLRPLFHQ
jgi:hypothetical protein